MSELLNNDEQRTNAADLPLIILEGAVILPHTAVGLPLDDDLGPAVEAALQANRLVLLVARREDADSADPLALQLHRVGVIARIEQSGKLPRGKKGVLVQGLVRATLGEQVQDQPYPRFTFVEVPDHFELTAGLESLITETHAAIDAVLALRELPQEVRNFVRSLKDPGQLADNTGYSPDYTFAERQELLETFDVAERLRRVRDFYRQQLTMLEVQVKLHHDVEASTSKQQREFYLRQQMRAIQKELGEDDAEVAELDDLREKLAAADLPEAARKEAEREMTRLSRMNTASPEYQMVRTYLEWVVELPWNITSGNPVDIAHSRTVLDQDHYGLEKIKERILEYLAVKQRRAAMGVEAEHSREPILVLVGPPGVGKTSLGQSIAKALGRNFIRMSLGGVHDEAELRGFRRTYIGSAPGRIIQELRRAGSADPVILLDEIDKLGRDYRGDPAAALLEVLDPEQNNSFTDHYLNVPFDLSKVLFIATANTFDTIPPALRDRMETIELSGYTEDEKVRIAQSHLVAKQRTAHGLSSEDVTLDEAALRAIIAGYTREAGVRNLERQIGGVLRKVTRQLAEDPAPAQITVDQDFIRTALGKPRFYNEAKERINQPGVSTGLVWTPVGGDIVFVEVATVPGTKQLTITGQLGEVMRESAEAALTYVRSRSRALGIDADYFDRHAVHIHVPGGAVPKDGPSAGVTLATALASVATGRLVHEDVAMTGEITLRGRVLPVGGIKEKVLGAHRAGIKTVILPRRNMDDLDDLPAEVQTDMIFIPVDTLDEVLIAALSEPAPAPWETQPGLFEGRSTAPALPVYGI